MKRLRTLATSRLTGLLMAVLLVALYFGLTSPEFRDPFNLLDRTRHWTEVGLIAVPMTLIIITGGIDLSVGSLLALAAIVTGICMRSGGWPLAPALLAGVATGLAGGALNGLLVSRFRVPPLVTTLGTMGLFRGLAMGLSQAAPIRDFPEGFTDWGSLATIDFGDYGLPQQFLILLSIVALGEVILQKTRAGRWTLQIGENVEAARFAGVPLAAVRFGLFLAMGLTCGLSSISHVARFATAHPSAGEGLELEAIACVVIGGTRITGGHGSVLGTFLGLLLIGLLRFGLDMRGVVQQDQIILMGCLVVVTAILNEWVGQRRNQHMNSANRKKAAASVA